MKFAILGLGEAGGALAADLAARGEIVYGWDPNPKRIPEGVNFAADNPDAARQADVVLSVNWASVAVYVAEEVRPALKNGQLYADLNTASPGTKRAIGDVLNQDGIRFADVALMAPVLPRGLGTPAVASGVGAQDFAQALTPLGMPVTVLDERPGSAAESKLLRSVFYKGVAAVILEALEAAAKLDNVAWIREQMLTVIADEEMLDRFVAGSYAHAERRMHEMTAVSDMLRELGVSPFTSEAAVQRLAEIQQKKETHG